MNFKTFFRWIFGLIFLISLIFNICLFFIIPLDPNNQLLFFFMPILISFNITTATPIYNFIINRPKLILDLESSRKYLINFFDTQSAGLEEVRDIKSSIAVTIQDGEEAKERSKYIRINLVNTGKKTAVNCRIKLHIFYSDFELVREPSNIYPAGFHHIKREKNLPPLINIAAGDSQIFDICSTNNRTENIRLLRFEDHFSHSRIEAINSPLFIRKIYYIKLFVYSDNNAPIEKNYILFLDPRIKRLDWQKINIKEFNWEKLKKHKKYQQKTKSIINKLKVNIIINKFFNNKKNKIAIHFLIEKIYRIFQKNKILFKFYIRLSKFFKDTNVLVKTILNEVEAYSKWIISVKKDLPKERTTNIKKFNSSYIPKPLSEPKEIIYIPNKKKKKIDHSTGLQGI